MNRLCLHLTVAMLVVSTGCSSFRTEMGTPLTPKSKEFTEGQTRVATVVQELGPPHEVSRLPDGFVFLYEYSRIKEFQLGFSMNLPVVHWFKFLKAWNHLDQNSLILTFDDRGVLSAVGSANWQESLGGGSGVQFLFMVMSFSDVSNFLNPGNAHRWGETLLQLPPVALNSGQNLLTGDHGLQQRLAPDYAGQHSLEMTTPKTGRQKKKIKKDYQIQREPPL